MTASFAERRAAATTGDELRVEVEPIVTGLSVAGRPLVVIDPEDREQVEQFIRAYFAEWEKSPASVRVLKVGETMPMASHFDAAQTAFRSLVAPPKPDEPKGWGAVVEDRTGAYFTLYAPESGIWINYAEGKRAWSDIDVARIVHEGVTA